MQNYKFVRKLRDMIVVRLTTLARTSSLLLLCRRWMRDQSMGMLAAPLLTQETETSATPFRIYHLNRDKFCALITLSYQYGKTRGDVHTREN